MLILFFFKFRCFVHHGCLIHEIWASPLLLLHSSYHVLVWSGFKILRVTRIRGGGALGQKERTDLGSGTQQGGKCGKELERGKRHAVQSAKGQIEN